MIQDSRDSKAPKPKGPVDQLTAGINFYAQLGFDVTHFGPMWHIFKVGQLLQNEFNRISVQHGISIADFHLLGALMMEEGRPSRATDLALALNVSNAVLTGRVRKLEAQGLLTRSPNEPDRRVTLLGITDTGVAKVTAISLALEQEGRFVLHFRQMPMSDHETLHRVMRMLHMQMDRDF